MKTRLLSEENYTNEMQTRVLPRLEAVRKSGYFRPDAAEGGYTGELYYEIYPLPKPLGNIVISHGFTENCVKYRELIYYFLEEGYQVFIMDHRGHGRSFRQTGDYSLTHVDHFREYVRDFLCFVRTIVCPAAGDMPLILFGHSMGGGIGAAVLEAAPGLFERAVLSSPMLEMNLGALPVWLAWLAAAAITVCGGAKKYVPGHHPYQGRDRFEDGCASGRARFDYYENLKTETVWMQNYGASCRWVMECIAGAARARSRRACRRVDCPVLVLQAEKDVFVTRRGEELFASRIRDGKCIMFPGSRHEIYRSENAVLERYMNTILDFLKK